VIGPPVHEQRLAGRDEGGGGSLGHHDAVRGLLGGGAGPWTAGQRLAVTGGVDDPPRADAVAARQHQPPVDGTHGATLPDLHGVRGEAVVEMSPQRGGVEHGVALLQVVAGERDRVPRCLGSNAVDGQVRQVAHPAAVRRRPRRVRVAVDEHGAQAPFRARGGERSPGRAAPDHSDVHLGLRAVQHATLPRRPLLGRGVPSP
jgi:hypothetical protein